MDWDKKTFNELQSINRLLKENNDILKSLKTYNQAELKFFSELRPNLNNLFSELRKKSIEEKQKGLLKRAKINKFRRFFKWPL